MKSALLKKAGSSLRRIAIALAVVPGIPILLYCLWNPGRCETLPDDANHAVWAGHGWLGDDMWFRRNARNPADFRDETKIDRWMAGLHDNHIRTVYPHLCPAQYNGRIAPYSDVQVERFLDAAERYQIQVIPWIGGVSGESARPEEEAWRKSFVESAGELLTKHPRLSGVQVNIEPMPDGNADFLLLLGELREVLGTRILSVAAYPPPTLWQRSVNVHWSTEYLFEVAGKCDQLAVMMYDTAVPLEKFYIALMTRWTESLVQCVPAQCELLLGIPAYEDAGVGYHRPEVENISSALRGIGSAGAAGRIGGIAIYCDWEMTESKWRIWRNAFQDSRNAFFRKK